MPDAIADRLGLPAMVRHNEDPRHTAYTVSADAMDGITTGISAADRAHTLNLLADPETGREQLVRPGHVFPLRAKPAGVLERQGHTEAATDLCRLAGLAPVEVISELVHDDGAMMRLPAVLELGAENDLPVVTIEQLIAWRQRHDRVERGAQTRLPTRHGVFTIVGYHDKVTGAEHLALISPLPASGTDSLVRLHSECLTGDVVGSQRCDCGAQLDLSLARVAAQGGVVVYLRGHEGRGVGLLHKLEAYALQDKGFDTVDAPTELGLPIDAREYAAGAAILHDLDLGPVRLLTNNPMKVKALRDNGIDVAAVERLPVPPNAENAGYLRTKRDRMGHHLVIKADDQGAIA